MCIHLGNREPELIGFIPVNNRSVATSDFFWSSKIGLIPDIFTVISGKNRYLPMSKWIFFRFKSSLKTVQIYFRLITGYNIFPNITGYNLFPILAINYRCASGIIRFFSAYCFIISRNIPVYNRLHPVQKWLNINNYSIYFQFILL